MLEASSIANSATLFDTTLWDMGYPLDTLFVCRRLDKASGSSPFIQYSTAVRTPVPDRGKYPKIVGVWGTRRKLCSVSFRQNCKTAFIF